jgi:hypothetical protein
MPSHDLRVSGSDATVWKMFDPIPILLARDGVRAAVEGPVPDRRQRAGVRLRAAAALHRLADRLEGRAPASRTLARA